MGHYYGLFRRKSEGREKDGSSKTGEIQVWEREVHGHMSAGAGYLVHVSESWASSQYIL